MPRLTHAGVELQRPANNYNVWFDFSVGGPADAVYVVRGEDAVIVGKPGRFVTTRKPDHLVIILAGWVEGQGATHTAKREDYLDLMAELSAVWDPALDPSPLIVSAPVEGLGTGMTATLNARFLRRTGPPKVGEFFARMTIYLECVDDPPMWVLGS